MLTQEYLKSRLEYDALTGVFTWKRRPGNGRTINTWNTRYAGQVFYRNGEFVSRVTLDEIRQRSI